MDRKLRMEFALGGYDSRRTLVLRLRQRTKELCLVGWATKRRQVKRTGPISRSGPRLGNQSTVFE